MKRLFCQKKIVVVDSVDAKDLNNFYQMLLKVKKKRTDFNVDFVMKTLYGNNFRDFL
jgi:hypothetical protein